MNTPSPLPFDVAALAESLRAAEEAHHGAERRLPKHEWHDWYAAYMLASRNVGPKHAARVADRQITEALGIK